MSGDAASDAPDAYVPGPCWPVDGTEVARGSIVLGTGEGSFVPMPDELPLQYGEQGGFHVITHAWMTGLAPGDPTDVLNPANPRTRFSISFVDTGKSINHAVCPNRLGYVPSSAGGYELARGVLVLYDTCYRTSDVFDRPIRIKVELLDADRGYTSTEKTITPRPPTNWDFNNPPVTGAGCPD